MVILIITNIINFYVWFMNLFQGRILTNCWWYPVWLQVYMFTTYEIYSTLNFTPYVYGVTQGTLYFMEALYYWNFRQRSGLIQRNITKPLLFVYHGHSPCLIFCSFYVYYTVRRNPGRNLRILVHSDELVNSILGKVTSQSPIKRIVELNAVTSTATFPGTRDRIQLYHACFTRVLSQGRYVHEHFFYHNHYIISFVNKSVKSVLNCCSVLYS